MLLLSVRDYALPDIYSYRFTTQDIGAIPFAFVVPYFPLLPVRPVLQEPNRWKVIPSQEIFA